ncbi:hypothetical protein AGR4C_Lc90057 [Agrobacterium tumefaciens str. Kerr 14]|uniref:Uncharacterized protein n=1 Tax=Agrobacterium tumefaciens str. Kerr 14 TaxID=1183424 RepID=A0A1S7S6E0_AGRTU|nr:hypothetical protein AGR4C_Lc90057 [Agrobacterium tumefaciens str. Kerr 14]
MTGATDAYAVKSRRSPVRWWIAQRTLERGSLLASFDVVLQARAIQQNIRVLERPQYAHHHEITGAELSPLKPLFPSKRIAQLLEPLTEMTNAAGGDTGFDRINRCKHPHDGTRARIRFIGKEAGETLCYVKHDRTGFEKNEIALLVDRHLAEWLHFQIFGAAHLGKSQVP